MDDRLRVIEAGAGAVIVGDLVGGANLDIVIAGTLPGVGPPGFSGTVPNELWLDTNGDGWLWDGFTWTNVGAIQGPPGTDAPQWHTGAGAPGSGLGAVGDFYIDTDTGDVYEKTDGTTWTLRVSNVVSSDVVDVVEISQAAYDALGAGRPAGRLYLITS